MAKSYFSMRNLHFLLEEVHNSSQLLSYPRYEHLDGEALRMMLDAAKDLADTHLFPHFADMDRKAPHYENGKVTVHPQIKAIIEAMKEGGWIDASFPLESGGMQAPDIILAATTFIFLAANNGAAGYTGLTTGSARLILNFGSQELKDTYLSHMLSGDWQGTMALTEPDAGSALSFLSSAAEPTEEGYFKMTGQKVFISGGDHNYTNNVVHLVLARIKGAPKGTKGISLFVVPKYRPDGSGGLVDNDVTTLGIYHKMGQKATPAVHFDMGSKSDCRGYLVGEPNKGLSYMFQMMNEARIAVGLWGAALGSAAYYASLEYAQERPQGKPLSNLKKQTTQIPIIKHPDVKRMLLLQKALTEGSLSLVLQCAQYSDLAHAAEGKEAKRYHDLLELLTPVAKTYGSEAGVVSVSNGLQCLGGYGYCEDFPLEQLYRDIRLTPIYEGTTGIQSLDLLGRKVVAGGGKSAKLYHQEVLKTITRAETHPELKKYAEMLKGELMRLQKVSMHLIPFAMKGEYERYLADATLFMEMFSIITVAWQWLKQAAVAKERLITSRMNAEAYAFYQSKIHTMKFYFAYEVPKTLGLSTRLTDNEVLTIDVGEEVFC